MGKKLILKWGPKEDPTWMTHGDLDILLTTITLPNQQLSTRRVLNITNAARLLAFRDQSYHPTAQYLQGQLASLKQWDAAKRYLADWEDLKSSSDSKKDDVERHQRARNTFKNLLQAWALGMSSLKNIQNLPKQAIERLCVGDRIGLRKAEIATSMSNVLAKNAHLPGYRWEDPIGGCEVERMLVYYWVTYNVEFRKWDTMAVANSAFEKSYKECQNDSKPME
ncbi:MAG: hypothetical protein L6R36_003655 [Xanthoria steineri]|nr:MAG: hypothetical protein L6R36_003655 [Xanthoria steineri]